MATIAAKAKFLNKELAKKRKETAPNPKNNKITLMLSNFSIAVEARFFSQDKANFFLKAYILKASPPKNPVGNK